MALPLKPKRLVQNGLVAHYAPIRQRNLLKWSEDFSNAVWSKLNCTVTNNNEIAPDGTLTADKIEKTSTDAYITQQMALNGDNIFSIWLKGIVGETTALYIRLAASPYSVYGLKQITFTDSEWHRYYVSANIPNVVCNMRVLLQGATGNATVVYAWGAQLELSPSATTYQRTTDLQTVWNQKQENMSVTNIVTNGNFASGTSGWISDLSTISITNNIATLKATARYGGIQQVKSYTPLTHKFYARAFVRADSNLVSFRIYDNVVFASKSHSGSGNFELLSTILTCNNGNVIKVYTNDDRTSGWTDVQIKEVMMFNLTSLFGAGNEPTTQQCDEIFSSWFDGSIRMNLNRYNGMLGSTSAVDVNDPTYDGTGLSFGGDDYVGVGNIGKEMRTCQIVFYTSVVINKASSVQALISFDTVDLTSIFLGSVTSGLVDEIITVYTPGGGRSGWCSSTGGISIGWHIIDVIWDGSKYKIYLDGVSLPISIAPTNNIVNITSFTLGRISGGTGYFSGKQAEILIYDRSLTDAELTQNRAVIKAECARLGVMLP